MDDPPVRYEVGSYDYEIDGNGGRRWLYLLLGGIIGLCAAAACILGAYFLLRPILARPTAPAPPAVPTLPGAAQTATADAASTSSPAATLSFAPSTSEPQTTPAPPAGSDRVEAFAVSTPPAVDGDFGEWPGVQGISSAYRVFAAGSWDGSSDLQATWRLAWDSQNLYVAVTIVDDLHVQTQQGTQIFRGDSVEMQIDTEPGAGATRVNPATYQIILSPGDFGGLPPSVVRFRGTGSGEIVQAAGHAIDVAARRRSDGYTLEAAIPWDDLNATASGSATFGLALNANDNDTPGSAQQEVMLSNVPTRTLTDPSTWGTLVLSQQE